MLGAINMKTIRWGIIGVGDVTEVKSGPPLYKCDNSALVAVMRRSGDKAKDYAERHNVPRWYDNGDDLIHDDDVDVVYVATPTHAHKSYVIQAAQAGKHVYCEKPMGVTYADCQEMIDACDRAGVSLWVAYYRRAMPRYEKVKSLIEDGTLGEILMVSIEHFRPTRITADTPQSALSWHHAPELLGGGNVLDVSCHTIDLLQHYFGDIISVTGKAGNRAGIYRSADTMTATFEFASGVVGTGAWNFTAGVHHEVITIVGTQGEIRFSVFSPRPMILTTSDGVETIESDYPQHVHQPLIESIIAELNGQGMCPSTGTSGAQTTRILDKLFAEYRESL